VKQAKENTMRNHGFTLIELLIVVAIIAILAAIAVPNFLEAQVRSKVTRCKNDLRTLAVAWEAYRIDNNEYPPDFDGGWVQPVISDGEWLTYAVATTPVAYLTTVPTDQFAELKTQPGFKTKPYYQYRAVLKSMVEQLQAGWPETGTWWFITSYGPDLEDGRYKDDLGIWSIDVSDPVQVVNWSYDTSNGTKSGGDLGRTNIRSFPAN
jgi:type II secretion system protein G